MSMAEWLVSPTGRAILRECGQICCDMSVRPLEEAITLEFPDGRPCRTIPDSPIASANRIKDALNAAMAASPTTVFSVMNQKAMGFLQGRAILPHAVGAAKPWARSYVREALVGRPPRTVDKEFWDYARGPVKAFNPSGVLSKRVALRLASGIGRVIKRA
jgi:hypothetical protein